jgi:hypothetical protein
MKVAELLPETIEKIKRYRWDRIIEKHEGPENWDSVFKYDHPEFIAIENYYVLLPIAQEHHSNITILRCIPSQDGHTLTLFLKDTTYEDDMFFSGFLAVCDKFPGQDFFLAHVYHEWFIFENQ